MRFFTRDFLHKWGFEDGDILQEFLHTHGFDLAELSTHQVLRSVLEGHVLPAIRNRVAWKFVSTLHNPVRITSVDGMKVDNYETDHPGITLRPEFVDVPDGVILTYARDASASRNAQPK
ncbi:MAG TPA: hypothetical protein VF590_03595 [Isosphaeraceae bacterium]|jgi:hypothetical protein